MDEERKDVNENLEQEKEDLENAEEQKEASEDLSNEENVEKSEENDEKSATTKTDNSKVNPQEIINEVEGDSKISQRLIQDEMKQSYIDYAMAVIIGRALPEVRDGLKPVHRRIMFAMSELKMYHNKPFKKCARIVGEVLGKYHPHGDTAVYDAMVRMAQDFSLRYPMIQGQGNFGSVDGDNAAAMRYTEARLSKLAEEMLRDIEKETVATVDNFDGSLQEPSVLPSKIPSLLLNGSNGIAVGMATSIPPHNLTEVCSGLIELVDNEEMTIDDLMEYVKGPDYPTGAIGYGRQGIINAYHTGHGRSIMRSRVEVEDKGKRKWLVVKEIPYQVNKTNLINEIVSLVKNKVVTAISDIRDESDSRTGIRLVIELKKDSNPEVVLNQLYKHSRLQTSFGITLLSIQDKKPKVMNLKEMMQSFLTHRIDIVTKRTEYDLMKAKAKEHILQGLVIALDNIDEAIRIIKAAKSGAEAKIELVDAFELTEIQAGAILDMKLQRLTGLEQDKIREELDALLILIKELEEILASPAMIRDIIKEELQGLIDRYGDARRTELWDVEDETGYIDYESIVEPEDVVITISHKGYIKRTPLSTYSAQNRGGKGIIGATTKDEDMVEHMFIANTKDFILFFTEDGKVHWLKVYRIPEQGRSSGGKAIVNILDLNDVKVSAFIKVKEFSEEFCSENYFVFATENGTVKKVSAKDLSRPRAGGIKAINLAEGDSLVNVVLTDGEQKLILATRNGKAVRFEEKNVRTMGRTATGVRGIRLKEDDKVVGLIRGNDEKTILTITDNGFGKRTKISDYRIINRGGSGVINILCSERNGKVISVMSTDDETEMMIITKNGTIIRTRAKDINVIGRNTQGVRIMKMKGDDRVVATARITGLDDKTEEEELEEDKGKDKSSSKTESKEDAEQIVEEVADDESLDSKEDEEIVETIETDSVEQGVMDVTDVDEMVEKIDPESKKEESEPTPLEKEKTEKAYEDLESSDPNPEEIEEITKDILRKNI